MICNACKDPSIMALTIESCVHDIKERGRARLRRPWVGGVQPSSQGGAGDSCRHRTARGREVRPELRDLQLYRVRCGHLVFANVMAWRETDKKLLRKVADPIGLWNTQAIEACIAAADLVIAAWGKIDPKLDIRTWFEMGRTHCLGVNNDGSPKHPLYLASNTPLETYP